MKNKLPAAVVPILEKVVKAHGGKAPLDFWTIDHGETILECFFGLATQLELSDIDQYQIPRGYSLLTHLFLWESECNFDGWGAFANISDKRFKILLQCFHETGLSAEAESLEAQMLAFQKDPDDFDALYLAVEQKSHALSGDLDRLEYLTQYFCDHADTLLYEKVTTSE